MRQDFERVSCVAAAAPGHVSGSKFGVFGWKMGDPGGESVHPRLVKFDSVREVRTRGWCPCKPHQHKLYTAWLVFVANL